MKIGFIGSGTITSAMVTGLSSTNDAYSIVLSPRNAKISADLALRFKNVRVASTNQAVLDSCEMAVLAVRPQVAAEVLSELRFRPDHQVLSVIATVPIQQLRTLTAPATSITRAVPLPVVARRQGPTVVYPPSLPVTALFNALGTAIELRSENEFETFSVPTAILASYFGFANTVASWMTDQGVAPQTARLYVADILQGLAGTAAAMPNRSFATLIDEHQTPGGLNEQVLKSITHDGLFTDLKRALDAVLKRTRGSGNS